MFNYCMIFVNLFTVYITVQKTVWTADQCAEKFEPFLSEAPWMEKWMSHLIILLPLISGPAALPPPRPVAASRPRPSSYTAAVQKARRLAPPPTRLHVAQ